MAKVFPTLEQINYLRPAPTEGEIHLLKFLLDNLDNSYEIYFQPFLNGDRPDIILMRPDAGVMIIEVKDWNLVNYKIDKRKKWWVTQDRQKWSIIKSPIEQVLRYKQNLYDLHIEDLLEQKIKNYKLWGIVTCAVYFHRETYKTVNNFLTENFPNDHNYKKFLSYLVFLGQDSLKQSSLAKILRKHYLHRPSRLFNDTLYKSFKRHLQPPYHLKEEGRELTYTDKQEKLIISQPKAQKVKGTAGSGKTCVLAKRAVNALKRISSESFLQANYHPQVLILTYNITIKNYIHDKISQVREDFPWGSFYIKNYHDFMTQELNNLGIQLEIPEGFDAWNKEERDQYFEDKYYSNIKLFSDHKDKINRYTVIFIDEIQDYQKEWVQIIRRFFLDVQGEFVVFGDEKQNVYERIMDDDQKPYTSIGGNWNLLKETFRLSSHLSTLATNFQAQFFQHKYEFESVNTSSDKGDFILDKNIIEYIPINRLSYQEIYEIINKRANKYMIHPNDICIQSSRIDTLREISFYAAQTHNIRTTTTFETMETYYLIILQILQKFQIKQQNSQESSYDINQIKEYQLKIKKLKHLFALRQIEHDKVNQAIIRALSFSFYQNHPTVQQKLKEYLRAKNIERNEYDQWVEQIVPILQQIAHNRVIMKRVNNELDKIRKQKKWKFWMNSGNVKISTIHSFKGWEIDTLFLIIESELGKNNFITDELIYTAITRCRRNLFILDLDQSRYHNFFSFLNSPF